MGISRRDLEFFESMAAGDSVDMHDHNGVTWLMYYAHNGDCDNAQVMLKAGARVNLQAINGLSALMGAANGGHFDVVKLLLDYGASVNQVDRYGYGPLDYAVIKNHFDVACNIVQARFSKNELIFFNSLEDIEVAKCILANGNIVKFHMSSLSPYLGKIFSYYAESIYGYFSKENSLYADKIDEVEIYRKDPVQYILENHYYSQRALRSVSNLEAQGYSAPSLDRVKECLRTFPADGELASICGEDSSHYDL